LSTAILFNRQYLRSTANILDCFSVERKNILGSTVSSRPWANGLNRLLAERRGLKKGRVAEVGHFRPALISAVLNSPKPPEIETLQRIATGFTTYDRELNPRAPEVELWEFFVSNEQAALLREKAVQHQTLAREEEIAAKIEQRIMARLAAGIREEIASELTPKHHTRKKPA
jgi:hypothetical protein